jgi:hypothetical protein
MVLKKALVDLMLFLLYINYLYKKHFMYNSAEVKKIVEQNVAQLSPLYEGMKFVDKIIGVKEDAGKIKDFIRENFNNAKGLYDFMYECTCGSKYDEIAEYVDYPLEEELFAEAPKTDLYFDTLSGALSAMKTAIGKRGFELADEDDLFNFGSGGIKYGETKRGSFETIDPIKNLSNIVHVQIYRMDGGKYELNFYMNSQKGKKIKGMIDEDGSDELHTYTLYMRDLDDALGGYTNIGEVRAKDIVDLKDKKVNLYMGLFDAAKDNMDGMDTQNIYVKDETTDAFYSFAASYNPAYRKDLVVIKTGNEDSELVEMVEETPSLELGSMPRHWGYHEGDEFRTKYFDESYDEDSIREIVESLIELKPVAFMNEDEIEDYLSK